MKSMSRSEIVGNVLQKELTARGWSCEYLALMAQLDVFDIIEIVNGRTEINYVTSAAIGKALGTSAEFWMNLARTNN